MRKVIDSEKNRLDPNLQQRVIDYIDNKVMNPVSQERIDLVNKILDRYKLRDFLLTILCRPMQSIIVVDWYLKNGKKISQYKLEELMFTHYKEYKKLIDKDIVYTYLYFYRDFTQRDLNTLLHNINNSTFQQIVNIFHKEIKQVYQSVDEEIYQSLVKAN